MADKSDELDLTVRNPASAIDIRKSDNVFNVLETRELSPYSPQWAKIVRPVGILLMCLIAAVMLLPFFLILWVSEGKQENILTWGNTVLPPVVGFGGALVGYYFGTRGNQQELSSEE